MKLLEKSKTKAKVKSKPKKKKYISKAKDPFVTLEFTPAQAKEFRKALSVFVIGKGDDDPLTKTLVNLNLRGFRNTESFNIRMRELIEKNKNESERSPSKKITYKVRRSLLDWYRSGLHSLIVQEDCTNKTRVLMKKHDPKAFNTLQLLLKKMA